PSRPALSIVRTRNRDDGGLAARRPSYQLEVIEPEGAAAGGGRWRGLVLRLIVTKMDALDVLQSLLKRPGPLDLGELQLVGEINCEAAPVRSRYEAILVLPEVRCVRGVVLLGYTDRKMDLDGLCAKCLEPKPHLCNTSG